MKLVFACSPSHDILKRHFFLATVCDSWEAIELRFSVVGNGNFGNPEFNRVITERVSLMHEIASDCVGEVIVFSDVDIQWFRPAQPAILQALESRDVVFQRELPERLVANCGFMALRSNERSIAYLRILCDGAKNGWHDQEITNCAIAEGRMPCSFGFLPNSFHNDNHSGRWHPKPAEMILYHSVGTFATAEKTSLQLKLERHLAMRSRILGSASIFRASDGAAPSLKAVIPMHYRPKDLPSPPNRQQLA